MAKTRGDLSQKTGPSPIRVEVGFEKIGGYNHIGRWIFLVRANSAAFAVEFVPRNLRHSRVVAFEPVSLPADLEQRLSDFVGQLFTENPGRRNAKSRTLRTPVELVRCVLSMLNNETLVVGEEALAEVARVVRWIFQNPASAASVTGQNAKWYYNHPILGNFYITEIPA